MLVLMLVGITVSVVLPSVRHSVRPELATLVGLLLAVWVFHSIVPAGVEDRKLIIAVPGMVLFVLAGLVAIADKFPSTIPLYRWRYLSVSAAAGVSFWFTTFEIPRVDHYGFTEAARFLSGLTSSKE